MKVGNGSAHWNDLSYVANGGSSSELGPATEKTFGTVRAWVEDGYICISTEDWVAFTNVQTSNSLTVQGSQNVVQQGNVLFIN